MVTKDILYALRVLRSHGWFSAAIVATLALGIGLNTMVFTLVNAVLFKPVAVAGGARLVIVNERNLNEARDNQIPVSYPDFLDYRAQSRSFEGLEAGARDSVVLSETGVAPQRYSLDRISAGLFGMVHLAPMLGRGLQASDAKPGAAAVLLISYTVWHERYGASPGIIGHVVQVDSKPATIIGVMPKDCSFPSDQDLWMPLVPNADLEKRSNRTLDLYGLLRPGTGIPRASTELNGIAQRLASAYPGDDKAVGAMVQTFSQYYNGGTIRVVFLSMLTAVGLLLLIVCANVANMMLSRALGRQREMAIRVALGASRGQVARQMLIETLALSLVGGALGLGLAALGVHWFDLSTQDVGKPSWILFSMNYAVFGYFAALCVVAGVVSGLAPALRSARVDPNSALKDGAQSLGATRRGGLLASMLVVAQFALTLVLLTGAGVFVRAFLEAQTLNRFMPSDHLMLGSVYLPVTNYKDGDAVTHFWDQLLARLRSIPGATEAALSSSRPEVGAPSRHIEIEEHPVADPLRGPLAAVLVNSPGYFADINLPILRGRDFNATDGEPGREGAVVTREFAARFWPRAEPIGKRFRFYTNSKYGPWLSVIGVSGDMAQQTQRPVEDPLVFVPYRQEGNRGMTVILRAGGNPAPLATPMRTTVAGLDRDLPVMDVRTEAEEIYHDFWYLRVFGGLFLVFSLIGLMIAALGTYAMIAQATARRTQEIGVRMALGASPRNILGLIMARGVMQLAIGLVIGLAAAYPAARVMATLPLPAPATGPSLFVAIALILIAVGLAASWIPARRAAGVNPVTAIRYE